jgi:hypothetical protein
MQQKHAGFFHERSAQTIKVTLPSHKILRLVRENAKRGFAVLKALGSRKGRTHPRLVLILDRGQAFNGKVVDLIIDLFVVNIAE